MGNINIKMRERVTSKRRREGSKKNEGEARGEGERENRNERGKRAGGRSDNERREKKWIRGAGGAEMKGVERRRRRRSKTYHNGISLPSLGRKMKFSPKVHSMKRR
ncbi:hypothetical protein EYF80_053755 [Liparis tanakae]|uniref:Uncharacterized protein n=1 Tax=Liparis tanakae TaxID=230148 RepID=A0A4Z2F4Q0_9TELE|nr:hypothetical protein EYF80_053755 [Liparis tanakae]